LWQMLKNVFQVFKFKHILQTLCRITFYN